jgi:threonyl-tRNA synthetase
MSKQMEAEKRNHQKLGQELELFMSMEEAPGMPFFLPNGMIVRNELENYWKQKHYKAGYQEIKTPRICIFQMLTNKTMRLNR